MPAGGPSMTFPTAILGTSTGKRFLHAGPPKSAPPSGSPCAGKTAHLDPIESLDVQQLQWLTIEPTCVLLNVRLKAKSPSGQIRRLQVKADASLQLLTAGTARNEWSSNSIREVAEPGGTTHTFDIQLPTSARNEVQVDLRFLCSGAGGVRGTGAPGHAGERVAAGRGGSAAGSLAGGVGSFRVPRIEITGAGAPESSRVGSEGPRSRLAAPRWIAVSIDPSLEWQTTSGTTGSKAWSTGTGSTPKWHACAAEIHR